MQILLHLLLILLLLAAFTYCGVCAYMYLLQSKILFPGAPHTPAAGTTMLLLLDTDEANVQITTDADTDADTINHPEINHADSAVLYFGGNAEDAASSYPALKKAHPHHAIYIMHYRGYTPSTGQASEKTLFADAAALYQMAQSRHQHIKIIGRSLGTGIACWLASHLETEKLVLVTPYDSMVNVAASHYPYLPVRWLLHNRFESWQYAPKITAPTLVIEAELDETIPPASTRGLLPHFADGVATHVVVEGAMHNTLLEHSSYIPLLGSI